MEQWGFPASPSGRRRRLSRGRGNQHLVRLDDDLEELIVRRRANEARLSVSGFLALAGLHFVAPADAPRQLRHIDERPLSAIRAELTRILLYNRARIGSGEPEQRRRLLVDAIELLDRLDLAMTQLDLSFPAPGDLRSA